MAKQKLLKTDFEFYTLDHLFKQCPKEEFYYYMIFGERSNGKTFSVQEYALREYLAGRGQLAYIRRWDSDWEDGNTEKVWEHFISNPYRGNVIEEISKGKWNSIFYRSSKWFLQKVATKETKIDNRVLKIGDVIERDSSPFAYKFSMNLEEHYKGTSYPKITTILFDEFITRGYYLRGGDEFPLFQSIISSIVRLENKARIFMLANSISTSCPYFREMGIRNVKAMSEEGQIDIYTYGENKELKVAVERTPNMKKRGGGKKKSNVYFAFDNPRLKMITQGGWEIDIYPHLPMDFSYTRKDVVYEYFIEFEEELFHAEMILKDDLITYIHRKTTPIREDNKNLVFSRSYNTKPNYIRRIQTTQNRLQKLIVSQFAFEKVYYQDNEIGESVKHYLDWATSTEN